MHALPPFMIAGQPFWLPMAGGASSLLLSALADRATPQDWSCGIACDPALAGWLLALRPAANEETRQNPQPFTIGGLAERAYALGHNGTLATWLVWQEPTVPADWQVDTCLADMSNDRSEIAFDSLPALIDIARRWLRDSSNAPVANSAAVSDSLNRVWSLTTPGDDPIEEYAPPKSPSGGEDLRRHWTVDESISNNMASELLPGLAARVEKAAKIERNFDLELEQAKLAAMKELAYGAGHEINNPLANISSRAQTLLVDETDPYRQKTLAAINRQAFRAYEMIADLMLFAHPPRLEYAEFAVAEVLEEVLAELTPDRERQGTSIRYELRSCDDRPIMLEADRVQIGLAIKALIRNSLESLGEAGEIRVVAERDQENGEDTCVLSIYDNGPGLTQEIRTHLFEPFFSGREAGRGLGFGLSKVWRIAEQHGGSVTVASETGATETCFQLRLPSRAIHPSAAGGC